MSGAALARPVGLFGKLPSHGDFLRRDLPSSFVEPFDAWLQQGLAASRTRLGERWLELFLVMPAWRFALAADVCGPDAMAGVLIPSVDSAGRYFPFTLAARLSAPASPLRLRTDCDAWFDAMERLAVAALADQFDLEPFLARLETEGAPLAPPAARMLHLADPDGLARALAGLALPWSLWWTKGSAQVPGASLLARGLPAPEAFTAFLDGNWSAAGIVEAGS